VRHFAGGLDKLRRPIAEALPRASTRSAGLLDCSASSARRKINPGVRALMARSHRRRNKSIANRSRSARLSLRFLSDHGGDAPSATQATRLALDRSNLTPRPACSDQSTRTRRAQFRPVRWRPVQSRPPHSVRNVGCGRRAKQIPGDNRKSGSKSASLFTHHVPERTSERQ
jgi:hypothetical protein